MATLPATLTQHIETSPELLGQHVGAQLAAACSSQLCHQEMLPGQWYSWAALKPKGTLAPPACSSVCPKLNPHLPAPRGKPWPSSYWAGSMMLPLSRASPPESSASWSKLPSEIVNSALCSLRKCGEIYFYSLWLIVCLRLFSSSYE